MALEKTWARVKHFKKTENWGDPTLVDDTLVLDLDKLREEIQCSIIINHAVKTSGHSKKSFHYFENGACAADVKIVWWEFDVETLLVTCLRAGFNGVGYYPWWNASQGTDVGLHVDKRNSPQKLIWISPVPKQYVYLIIPNDLLGYEEDLYNKIKKFFQKHLPN